MYLSILHEQMMKQAQINYGGMTVRLHGYWKKSGLFELPESVFLVWRSAGVSRVFRVKLSSITEKVFGTDHHLHHSGWPSSSGRVNGCAIGWYASRISS